MKKTIAFQIGEVCFSVGFFDSDLTIPVIEAYVYVGIDNDEFLFIDVTGHMAGPDGETPEFAHYLNTSRRRQKFYAGSGKLNIVVSGCTHAETSSTNRM